MFEKYIIVEEGTENINEGNSVIGYKIAARVPYYRGLGISMLENIELTIDDNSIDPKSLIIEIHGNQYSLAQMEIEAKDRWEFGEVGNVMVMQAGGLSNGPHKITLAFTLRISYMPVLATRKDTKTIQF